MSRRLQVLIPEELERRIEKTAQRTRVSKGELVRRALEMFLRSGQDAGDPVSRLAALDAPTADIDQMLREIEAGRD